jgi:hypothetical protein
MRFVVLGVVALVAVGAAYAVVPDVLRYLRLRDM